MTSLPNHEHLQDWIHFRMAVIEALANLQAETRHQTRLLKAYLSVLTRGRPRHKNVTRATEMRRAGIEWPKIYRVCLPPRFSYDSQEDYDKAKRALRNAVGLRQVRVAHKA